MTGLRQRLQVRDVEELGRVAPVRTNVMHDGRSADMEHALSTVVALTERVFREDALAEPLPSSGGIERRVLAITG
jgi:hypothetical protein